MYLSITVFIVFYLAVVAFYLFRFWQHEREMQHFANVMQQGLKVYGDKVEKLNRENPEIVARRRAARYCDT
ncbi:MAG: hypothetical protein DHS20C07_19060 [Methyloligella sp.]|nr:MAG: hypothetical protein DHS20C07_19060 [Methyloligella sp.]